MDGGHGFINMVAGEGGNSEGVFNGLHDGGIEAIPGFRWFYPFGAD